MGIDTLDKGVYTVYDAEMTYLGDNCSEAINWFELKTFKTLKGAETFCRKHKYPLFSDRMENTGTPAFDVLIICDKEGNRL